MNDKAKDLGGGTDQIVFLSQDLQTDRHKVKPQQISDDGRFADRNFKPGPLAYGLITT